MDYTFQFSVITNNWPLFLQGVWLTVQLSGISIAIGLTLGVAGAAARTDRHQVADAIAGAYVEAIRNTPFLVQLLFIFFGLPSLGIKISAGQAAIVALSINFGAYATEIIRAGIESIQTGQIEAGLSLGFKRPQVFRHIILIPALANVFPALVGQMILLVLGSSIVSQIAAEELTFVGTYIDSRTFRSFEIYLTITLIYLALAWSLKGLAHVVELKLFRYTQFQR